MKTPKLVKLGFFKKGFHPKNAPGLALKTVLNHARHYDVE